MKERNDDRFAIQRINEQLGNHPRKSRDVKSAGELLARVVARRGFTQGAFDSELQAAWQQAVGEEFAGKTRATRIRRGMLEIIVDSSPALQQLGFVRNQLLADIQAAMPDAAIKGLTFRVGNVRN